MFFIGFDIDYEQLYKKTCSSGVACVARDDYLQRSNFLVIYLFLETLKIGNEK